MAIIRELVRMLAGVLPLVLMDLHSYGRALRNYQCVIGDSRLRLTLMFGAKTLRDMCQGNRNKHSKPQ
ncbi:predicted protein [Sclerotinia sclerotiorum 1980 UF-70]|uniref:Uncharacterized protein n=1 Tax=Sclerotinia sclerotiorum (strain ATCC 18683 / 1980 / Ss-1) TaxID=665079 RepID=A7ES59_SCLS1|nr:predicted protein [Sclerotinia sclerotiorum 1980 UF-70]EDN92301.1 predicted protein [Sclerotinia sclerotiorum 1980 UF-70]